MLNFLSSQCAETELSSCQPKTNNTQKARDFCPWSSSFSLVTIAVQKAARSDAGIYNIGIWCYGRWFTRQIFRAWSSWLRNQLKDDLSPLEYLRNKVLEQTDRTVLAQGKWRWASIGIFQNPFCRSLTSWRSSVLTKAPGQVPIAQPCALILNEFQH